MGSGRILNLGSGPSETRREESSVNDEATLQDLVEQTRSDIGRTRLQFELQQEEHEANVRRTKMLSIILGVLIVSLIGAFWFAYPILKEQKIAPESLGLEQIAKTMSEQVQSLESRLADSTSALPGLADRMDKLQTSMKSNLQAARSQAQAAATQVGRRIKEDIDRSLVAVQSRMAGIESNQHESHERVTQLQEEVAGLKRELASMREQNVNAAETLHQTMLQLQEQQEIKGKELSGLDQRVGSNQAALDALANRVDRQRIEFDIPNRQNREIAPGVSLTINRVDVGRQQFDGSLQFGADSRKLTIRKHDIQDPISFYVSGDNRPAELILTQVSRNGASGYVVMPAPLTIAEKVRP